MNQILIVGSSKSGKLTLVKELFGDKVDIPLELTSHSGLIFNNIEVRTKYYNVDVGLWVDEFNDREMEFWDINDFKKWCEELLSEEAKIIRDVLKGVIFTFDTTDKDALSYITDASEILLNLLQDSFEDDWDGFKLSVGFQKNGETLDRDKLLEMDDIWLNNGFEFIWFEEKSQDGVKLGKDRVMEVFLTNDWNNRNLATRKNLNDDNEKGAVEDEIDDSHIEEMFAKLLDDYDDDHDDNEVEEKDINYEDLVHKLQNVKFEISKLDDQNDKKKLAAQAITNLIKYL